MDMGIISFPCVAIAVASNIDTTAAIALATGLATVFTSVDYVVRVFCAMCGDMMKKAAQNVKAVAVRAGMLMKDTKGENYVDTAVKILIAVVLGALLLAGLYALFGDVVMPTLTQRIQDMFNYAG